MSNKRKIKGHAHTAVHPAPDQFSMDWDLAGVNLYGPRGTSFRLPRHEVGHAISGLAAYLEHMVEHAEHDHEFDSFDEPLGPPNPADADDDIAQRVEGLRGIFPEKSDAELIEWLENARTYLGGDGQGPAR